MLGRATTYQSHAQAKQQDRPQLFNHGLHSHHSISLTMARPLTSLLLLLTLNYWTKQGRDYSKSSGIQLEKRYAIDAGSRRIVLRRGNNMLTRHASQPALGHIMAYNLLISNR